MALIHRLRSRRIQRQRSEDLRAIGFVLMGCATYALLGAFIGWMLVNTALRCGDAIYYTDGTWKTGDCWLHWHTPVEGTW